VRQQPADLGRARGGRERGVDAVDVERQERGAVADPRGDALRVVGRCPCAQLVAGDDLEAPSARSSRSEAAYSDPRMPASSERDGSIRPSSNARLNGVPWK
jgi:hypothetical protein